MPEGGDSFLPRIQSVFYAIFDLQQGPKIVYQVPEGLIGVSQAANTNNNGTSVPPTPSTDTSPIPPSGSLGNGTISRNSSTSLVSPTELYRPGRYLLSPLQRGASSSSQRTLFQFNDISMYVIPHASLCGRLVTFSTRRHRIIGFPVELKGKYKRNYFRYNLCFVFDRGADLSCYEPIVRKVSRVLKSCEEESAFLSNPQTSPNVHLILEQLYEDLNSYSETSIAIDRFNSIELKIFPFYPNPPAVKDWMVPLALINLTKRVEENWDLTMAKIVRYIDGVNHVSRIAHLADCDITFTRKAIAHLLYYQVIMTTDIFQYSNMYTLRKSVQWLADEPHVKEECGPYVTKPGRVVPDWPKLLHLYSRLRGKTVIEWMQAYEVEGLGIDVRRFTSFGVIKGFLRRVHRFPIYIPPDPSMPIPMPPPAQIPLAPSNFNPISESTLARKRGKSLTATPLRFPPFNNPFQDEAASRLQSSTSGAGPSDKAVFPTNTVAEVPTQSAAATAAHRARRASAAEKVLEQLHSRLQQKSGASVTSSNPRTSWIHYQTQNQFDTIPASAAPIAAPPNTAAAGSASVASTATTNPNGGSTVNGWDGVTSTPLPSTTMASSSTLQESPSKPTREDREHRDGSGYRGGGRSDSRRQSLISPAVPPPSPVLPKLTLASAAPSTSTKATATARSMNRLSRASSVSQPVPPNDPIGPGYGAIPPGIVPQLVPLLDGDHNTDEICVKFQVGWPCLEQWLVHLGGGTGDGDFGANMYIILQ